MNSHMKATKEDIDLWHASGEEIYRYSKEIMALDDFSSILICALCTALARALISSTHPKNLDECARIRETITHTLTHEIVRIADEELLKLLRAGIDGTDGS